MNKCKDCRALWPVAFALTLAMLVSFPAWATLDLMAVEATARVAGTALVFCTTATVLVLYVRRCIQRNCALRRAIDQRRKAVLVPAPR